MIYDSNTERLVKWVNTYQIVQRNKSTTFTFDKDQEMLEDLNKLKYHKMGCVHVEL